MKSDIMRTFSLTFCVFLSTFCFSQSQKFKRQTKEPPMGWNSYDAYHGAITEDQFTDCVDWLAEHLLPFGYTYAVVDFCWYRPGPEGWDEEQWRTFKLKQTRGAKNDFLPSLCMDEYGRLLPDTIRWPSAANGVGFKAMANYVHSKGMQFGIHIMRGIPREAVYNNSGVLATKYHAADIACLIDTCPWMNHMYGVDVSQPGSQAYYNSLFNLYAEWEVDFVKADDMMVPPYRAGEIEMMRRAIDQCGRPMVLSLSCGEAPLSFANHLNKHANMWRISADFWDNWDDIERMFELAESWSPYIGNGTWPDADMIPIGRLNLSGYPSSHGHPSHNHVEHVCRLTNAEQRALMSLWCIIRSPLMWGGDPLSCSKETMSLLTNVDVLTLISESRNNRQIYERRDSRVWIADIEGSDAKYIGLFNLKDDDAQVLFELFWDGLSGRYSYVDLWDDSKFGVIEERFTVELKAHEGRLYKITPLNK